MTEELSKPDGEVRLKPFGVFTVKETKMGGGRLRRGDSAEAEQELAGETYYRVKFRASRVL